MRNVVVCKVNNFTKNKRTRRAKSKYTIYKCTMFIRNTCRRFEIFLIRYDFPSVFLLACVYITFSYLYFEKILIKTRRILFPFNLVLFYFLYFYRNYLMFALFICYLYSNQKPQTKKKERKGERKTVSTLDCWFLFLVYVTVFLCCRN